MGEIVVEVELENQEDRVLVQRGYLDESEIRHTRIPAIADTGAMMLALPEDVVRQLGLQQVDSITARYADGRRDSLPVAGPLNIQIGERSMPTDCIVVPAGADALIGQLVMERLDLVADCTHQTLTPRPESPNRPLVRL
ncbi:MAG: retroviral-like aspartic protease family protein [Chloroflexota bacterium]|nr:retroviral-like aspartic protease family protein [Chloroflexota bacterium]